MATCCSLTQEKEEGKIEDEEMKCRMKKEGREDEESNVSKENSSWKCGKDSSTKEERKEVLSITNLRQKENKASGVPVLQFTERERKKEKKGW